MNIEENFDISYGLFLGEIIYRQIGEIRRPKFCMLYENDKQRNILNQNYIASFAFL